MPSDFERYILRRFNFSMRDTHKERPSEREKKKVKEEEVDFWHSSIHTIEEQSRRKYNGNNRF